jgi:hypothetical protein
MERAMGIEPIRKAVPELENKVFGAMANPKCDGRVNIRGMRGNAGLRETTPPFAIEFPLSDPLLPMATGRYRAVKNANFGGAVGRTRMPGFVRISGK